MGRVFESRRGRQLYQHFSGIVRAASRAWGHTGVTRLLNPYSVGLDIIRAKCPVTLTYLDAAAMRLIVASSRAPRGRGERLCDTFRRPVLPRDGAEIVAA